MSVETQNINKRIYWQCRRGMLELDSLLQSFLEHYYADLDNQERKSFEQLLTNNDTLLLEYFMGRTVPMDPDTANVVFKIRESAKLKT